MLCYSVGIECLVSKYRVLPILYCLPNIVRSKPALDLGFSALVEATRCMGVALQASDPPAARGLRAVGSQSRGRAIEMAFLGRMAVRAGGVQVGGERVGSVHDRSRHYCGCTVLVELAFTARRKLKISVQIKIRYPVDRHSAGRPGPISGSGIEFRHC